MGPLGLHALCALLVATCISSILLLALVAPALVEGSAYVCIMASVHGM